MDVTPTNVDEVAVWQWVGYQYLRMRKGHDSLKKRKR